jgi:hypothetical protein
MPRGRPVPPIELDRAERRALQRWSRREDGASTRLALRARIILLAARPSAMAGVAIAERLRVPVQTVSKWRGRFLAGRLTGLFHRRRGRRST